MADQLKVVIRDNTVGNDKGLEPLAPADPNNPDLPAHFDYITENVYISPSLQTSKDRKRAKRMVCDCQFDPEQDDPEDACGENCINRLLMIECGSRCPSGEYCNNKNFQRAGYAKVAVFKTEKKGWGLKATQRISEGSFVLEYCGEVCTISDFERRKIEYSKEKRRHYYFMSLKTDEILDATRKGNLSRYINHSCDPNCETQKWTVNGRLCIGFFSVRQVEVEEELTFDYQFKRFGDVAQKCYCGAVCCRGYLGQAKQTPPMTRVSGIQDENHTSPQSPSSGRRRGRQRLHNDADSAFEKDIYDIIGSSWRLKDSAQVVAISRTMLQAETPSQRTMLLQVMQATEDQVCLKKFLSLQGLRLLWSWLVDSADLSSSEILQFRIHVLQTLAHLPVSTKNQLDESKLLPVVMRWAESSNKPPLVPKEEPIEELGPVSTGSPSKAMPSSDKEVKEGTIKTEADSAPLEVAMETEIGKASLPCDSANVKEVVSRKMENDGDKACMASDAVNEGDAVTTIVVDKVGTLEVGVAPNLGGLGDVASVDEAVVCEVSEEAGLSGGIREGGTPEKGWSLDEVKRSVASVVDVVEEDVVSGMDMIAEGGPSEGEVALKKSDPDVMEVGVVKVEASYDSSTHVFNSTPEVSKDGALSCDPICTEVGVVNSRQRIDGKDMTSEAKALERLVPSRGEPDEGMKALGEEKDLKVESVVAKVKGMNEEMAVEKMEDVKVDGMKEKIEDVKVDGMKETMEDVKVEGMNVKVESVKEKVVGVKEKVEGMKVKVEGMNVKVDGVKEKVDGMKEKVEGVKEKVEGMNVTEVVKEESVKEKVEGVKEKVEGMNVTEVVKKESVKVKEKGSVKEKFADIKEKMEDVKKIVEGMTKVEGLKNEGEERKEDAIEKERKDDAIEKERKVESKNVLLEENRTLQLQLEAIANELLDKWACLKEIFRIPKRTRPPAIMPKPAVKIAFRKREVGVTSKERGEEGQEAGVSRRHGHMQGRREGSEHSSTHYHLHQAFQNQLHQPRSSHKMASGHNLSPLPSSPHTPPYLHAQQTTPTSSLYPTPPGSGGSVQSTVIVQQPGQSICVQQQIFRNGCHQTTILPMQYISTSNTHTPCVQQLHQTTGSQTPLRSSPLQLPSERSFSPGHVQPQIAHTGHSQPPGHSQSPGHSQVMFQPPGHSQSPGLSPSPLQPRGHLLQQSGQTQIQPPGHLQPQVQSPGHFQPQVQPPGHLQPLLQQSGQSEQLLFPVGQPHTHRYPPPGHSQLPQTPPHSHHHQAGNSHLPHQTPGHSQLQHQIPGHPQPKQQNPGHSQPQQQNPGHPQPQHQNPGHSQPQQQPPGRPYPQHQNPGHSQPQQQPPGRPYPQHLNPGHPQPQHQAPGHPQSQYQVPGHLHPQHQPPGHLHPQHQFPGHLQPQHEISGLPQPQHQIPGHPHPQEQTPGHPHRTPGHPHPQHLTPDLQSQHQNLGHPQPHHQNPGHPQPQHQNPGQQSHHQSPGLFQQITPAHQVQPHTSNSHLPPSHPLLSGSLPPNHHNSPLPHPTTSLQPPPSSTTTSANVPTTNHLTAANPTQGLPHSTPLFGISSLPNAGAASMLGSQPTASLSAVLHAGITPAPYPSGALGSSRVNPTLAPSAHNPAVSGCVLLPSALGNLGVGQRRGASGSHTAVARATNVVPQDGLLPTPLLMQGQSAAATPLPLPLHLPAQNDVSRSLPPNWKMAKDENGKCYYYHVITRKTQWDPPAALDEGTIVMDLGTPEHSVGEEVSEMKGLLGPHTPTETGGEGEGTDWSAISQTLEKCTPSNLMSAQCVPLSPGHTHGPTSHTSPRKTLTATRSCCGMNTPPFDSSFSLSPSPHPHTPPFSPPPNSSPTEDAHYLSYGDSDGDCSLLTPPTKRRRKDTFGREEHMQKEAFRHSLSKTVISCLDHHRKSDCKYGRITCAQDFKYLARKLTYGLTDKESSRKKGKLECTDSVKAKVKEYIRQYMKRFGPVYKK